MNFLNLKLLSIFCIAMAIISCQKPTEEKTTLKLYDHSKSIAKSEAGSTSEPSMMDFVDLENKGIGPISEIVLNETLNQDWVNEGQSIFSTQCIACHKMEQRFIGPKLAGVTQRRAPEWIMNMILNPETMIANDPIAQKMLVEYNNAQMLNLGLSETEARSVLEYFRSVDQ
ncbi:MAG: cytochrome c [Flavobacteriaceae bacterium]|nr:cytochrome c [Flavobacteriaceae bacterium]